MTKSNHISKWQFDKHTNHVRCQTNSRHLEPSETQSMSAHSDLRSDLFPGLRNLALMHLVDLNLIADDKLRHFSHTLWRTGTTAGFGSNPERLVKSQSLPLIGQHRACQRPHMVQETLGRMQITLPDITISTAYDGTTVLSCRAHGYSGLMQRLQDVMWQ